MCECVFVRGKERISATQASGCLKEVLGQVGCGRIWASLARLACPIACWLRARARAAANRVCVRLCSACRCCWSMTRQSEPKAVRCLSKAFGYVGHTQIHTHTSTRTHTDVERRVNGTSRQEGKANEKTKCLFPQLAC